jgi:hypothetical protein
MYGELHPLPRELTVVSRELYVLAKMRENLDFKVRSISVWVKFPEGIFTGSATGKADASP